MNRMKKSLVLLLVAVLSFTPAMQVCAAPTTQSETVTGEDETLNTKEVEEATESPSAEPTVAPSALPQATATAPVEEEPVTEPTPSALPEVSASPEISVSPTPEAMPTASNSPEEAPDIVISPSPDVGETPLPDVTPDVSMSPTPEASPVVSASPSPSAFPEEEHPVFLNSYIDVEHTVGTPAKTGFGISCDRAVSLPASYDGRTAGVVSSVKDQNPFGTCWAFSAVAMAESAYMRLYNKEADLSERHLVEFLYNGDDAPLTTETGNITGDYASVVGDTQEQRGGNSMYTTFALAAWKGVADEAVDSSLEYATAATNGEIEIDAKYAFTDAMHLENAYWIPMTDTAGVKNAVLTYGAVGISYMYSATYDSSWYDGEAYYCPVASNTNHAVTIVGWDDNYFIENFKTTKAYSGGTNTTLPSSNGAWLIKNSWGSGYHDGGYFWISYEDATLADTAFAFDFNKADNYDYNYQYDGGYSLGRCSAPKAAAVYTATGNQDIRAVGVAFGGTDVSYKVKVYTGLSNRNNPESGTLQTTKTGKSTYEGYYTIELDEKIQVEEGESFSVVIETTDSSYVPVYYDATHSGGWIDFSVVCNKGETFLYGNGWEDATEYFNGTEMTIRIKAYADDSKAIFSNMISEIEDQEYTGEAIVPEVEVKVGSKVLNKGTDYTVSCSANINVGTATLTVTGIGDYYGNASKTFKIIPKTITEEMVLAPEVEYTGEVYSALEVSAESYNAVYYVDVTPRGKALTAPPKDAGNYVVAVTGRGNYQGTVEKAFRIDERDVTPDMITVPDAVYNGTAYNKAAVTWNEKSLSKEHYVLTYYADETPRGEALTEAPTEAGTYWAVLTGQKNFEGSAEKLFVIEAYPLTEEMISAEKAVYSGEAYAGISVTALGKKLQVSDYEVTYYVDETPRGEALASAPVDAGNYVAVVEGLGNYQDTAEATFTIDRLDIGAAKIILNYSAANEFLGISVRLADKEMESDEYDITYYDESGVTELNGMPVEIGSYVVKITGKGNYCGSTECSFKIPTKQLSAAMFEVTDAVYDGTEQSVVTAREGLIGAEDYTIKYNKAPINAGTYTVTIEGKGKYEGTLVYSFEIKKLELTEELVTDMGAEIYTGSAIKPVVEVISNGNLISSKNYSVKYTDNTKVGIATITVTGKSNCQGVVTKTFEILPKSVEGLSVSVAKSTYSGSELKPKITVTDGKKKLSEGKDYTVDYNNTTNADTDLTDTENPKVTITGINNYNGEKETFFTIAPYSVTAKKVKADLYRNADGDTVLDIRVNGEVVTAGADYSFTIKDQSTEETVNLGDIVLDEKYTIQLNFDEENLSGNYTSADIISIKNVACRMDMEDFELKFVEDGVAKEELTDLVYTGKAQKPKVTVVANGETLAAKHYTVSYVNNVNAGTATVTVTGKGSYAGSISKEFEILPKEIGATMKVSAISDKTYTGSEIKPSVTIKGLKAGENKDFWIAGYNNNINVNHENDAQPVIHIQFSDNYRVNNGQTLDVTFNILPAKISSVKAAKAYYKAGEAVKPELIVKAGKITLAETDYTVVWNNNLQVGKASAVITADGNMGNFYTAKPMEVKFNITRESLAKAKAVQIKSLTYTGEVIDFNEAFVLYDEAGEVIDKSQYEATPTDRINAGSVSVTFKAKEGEGTRFTGKKTVKCKVAAAYIGDFLELTEVGLPDKYYNNGKAITFTSKELQAAFMDEVTGQAMSTKSFSVKYADNKKAGKATLYITGKGNYSGTAVLHFDILYK